MSLILLPDVEALVISALGGRAEVQTALPGGVHGQVPARPLYPLAVVSRAGGGANPVPPWLDRARVQVDVYGTTKSDAHDGAQVVLAALHDLVGPHAQGVVTAVDDENTMQWLPDQPTFRARYVNLVWIHAHPLPA